MFDLGMAIVASEFRWVARRPGVMAKALFSVLIVLALVDIWRPVVTAGFRVTSAIVLVAALNNAQPAVVATVLAYFVISALTVIPYVTWRRRNAPAPLSGATHGEEQGG